MLLAFDIGNSHIVVGGFDGQKLAFEFKLDSRVGRTADEYAAILLPLLEHEKRPINTFTHAIIASVVPAMTVRVQELVRKYFRSEALVVGPGLKTGLVIRATDPASVGADRVVNAVAAKALFGGPCLVVDFGTATSFDLINAQGEYEGGVIAPGPMASLESLVQHTAKLPRIDLMWPKTIIGKTTQAAMQSGVVVGYTALVDGLIERIRAEVGELKYVLATGPDGKLFCEHSAQVQQFIPDLTLQGLRIIAELNRCV
ncbi:MAG: type III pantothenate kinase [Oligoflexia bacterium]|nr:type III pantothenate kinase [Oligoflexia bacterium]